MTGADLIGRATPVKAAAAQSGKDLELFAPWWRDLDLWEFGSKNIPTDFWGV